MNQEHREEGRPREWGQAALAWRAPGAVAAISILAHLPALLFGSSGLLWTVDELAVARSAVERWLGVPPTTTAWPAGPQLLFAQPLVGGALLRATVRGGAGAAVNLISDLAADPWPCVMWLRVLTVVCVTAAFMALCRVLMSAGKDGTTAAIVSSCLMLSPAVVQCAAMASADGIAIAAAIGAIACALGTTRRLVWAGMLIGVSAAARVSYGPALVALLFLFVVGRKPNRIGVLADARRAFSAAGVAFACFCPFVWIDPTRMAKAVIGQLTRGGTALGLHDALLGLASALGLPLVALLVFAIGGYRPSSRGTAMAMSLCVGVIVVYGCSRSSVFYDRYAIPLILGFVPVLVEGDLRCGWHARLSARCEQLVHCALLGLGIVAISWSLAVWWSHSWTTWRESLTRRAFVGEVIARGRGRSIALPLSMLTGDGLEKELSRESCKRMADATLAGFRDSVEITQGHREFVAVKHAVGEFEMSLHARLLLWSETNTGSLDAMLWTDPLPARVGARGAGDAQRELRDGHVACAVLPSFGDVSFAVAEAQWNGLTLYCRR